MEIWVCCNEMDLNINRIWIVLHWTFSFKNGHNANGKA
jgi:hypothetical protein